MQKSPPEDQAASPQSTAAKRRTTATSPALQPLSAGLGVRIDALERQAKAAISLLSRVQSTLAEPEKSHVLSASYHEDTLVITMDSAVWGANLRYQENSLRDRLAALGEKPFTHLKVRIGRP